MNAEALQIEKPWTSRIMPWLALIALCTGLMGSGWKFVYEPKIQLMVDLRARELDKEIASKLDNLEKKLLAEIRLGKVDLRGENQRINDKLDRVIWKLNRD